jgi:hypothetical protein
MAKQTTLFLPVGFVTAGVTIVPADTTAWKTVYTAASNDAVVKGLACVSDDTAAVNVRIGIDVAGAGTVRQIATVNIPIAAGTNGADNAVDLLNAAALPFLPVDRNGKRHLPLKAGDILKVAALATVTASKTITVTALAEEY